MAAEQLKHPLAMDLEDMRRAGYATVDALVARLADPEADPVVRRAEPVSLRSLVGGPPPEQPRGYIEVLAQVIAPTGACSCRAGFGRSGCG